MSTLNKNMSNNIPFEYETSPATRRHDARELAQLFKYDDNVWVTSRCEDIGLWFRDGIEIEHIKTLMESDFTIMNGGDQIFISCCNHIRIKVARE